MEVWRQLTIKKTDVTAQLKEICAAYDGNDVTERFSQLVADRRVVLAPAQEREAFLGRALISEFGFKKNPTFRQLRDALRKRGARLCGPEVAFALRSELNDTFDPSSKEDEVLCVLTRRFNGGSQFGRILFSVENVYDEIDDRRRTGLYGFSVPDEYAFSFDEEVVFEL